MGDARSFVFLFAIPLAAILGVAGWVGLYMCLRDFGYPGRMVKRSHSGPYDQNFRPGRRPPSPKAPPAYLRDLNEDRLPGINGNYNWRGEWVFAEPNIDEQDHNDE